MYIWVGLSLCRKDEDKIRSICRRINESYRISEVAFILPQHTYCRSTYLSKSHLTPKIVGWKSSII